MKKYLISGIGPGPSGVGRLINILAPEYHDKGYYVITRRHPRPFRQLIKRKKIFDAGTEIALRCFDRLSFQIKCLRVLQAEVIFLHPQTAGFWLFFYLVVFNKVSLYVMDNSFFCICSYNTHPVAHGECLKCVAEIRPHQLCAPYPVRIPKNINIYFLKKLKSISSRLTFLAQNNLQSELLYAHFGKRINVSIIGMNAESGDCSVDLSDGMIGDIPFPVIYDVVFHGASKIAKGLFFVLEIAELMPEFSFFVPDKLSNIMRIAKIMPSSNVFCEEVTWETGLREAVACARLVINPSMWSAPIEGALVKSGKYNNNVATVESKYGYEAETKMIRNHIRLPRDPLLASEVLRDFLNHSP